jgi:hypothetical protein
MKSDIKINNKLFNSEVNSKRIEKEQNYSSINPNEIKDIETIVNLLDKLNEEKLRITDK